MSVWLTIPSARPPEEAEKVLKLWRERGYQIALWRDDLDSCDMHAGVIGAQYPGYAAAVNHLVDMVIRADPKAEWFVIGGDDVHPDLNHSAEEIAAECRNHFKELSIEMEPAADNLSVTTFGVMQPTGDRWGENPNHPREDMRSAYIDRVAGSAWLGREFCKRVNGGRGPLWPEYQHMFVDEELFAVANKLGIYWPRRDLTHYHAHAGRVKNYTVDMIPEHLKKWTTSEHWKEAEKLFFSRRDAGFPGHEPI